MQISLYIFMVQILFILSKDFLELNNESFNKLVESNKYDKNKKLLVIFYAKNCPNCEEAIKIISNDILKQYSYDNKIDFAKVDCDLKENIWLDMRFNITRIPYIILIKGNYFYELKSNYDKYELNNFINDRKDIRELKLIPNDTYLLEKQIIVFKYNINYITQYIYSHYGINISDNIIIFILIILFILFLWLLKYLLVLCCKRLCTCGFCSRFCRKKIDKTKIIKIIKEDNFSQKSNNDSGISGNDMVSKGEENESSDTSEITDSFFDKQIEHTIIEKKYIKKKIE